MHDRSLRWLDAATIAGHVRYMVTALAADRADRSTAQHDRQNHRLRNTMFAMVGAAVALAVLMGMLVAFAEPVPGKEPDYAALVGICLAVVLGAGGLTYAVSGKNNVKRDERDAAICAFCERAGSFRFAGRCELEDHYVGTIPWFTSEEWSHVFGLMVAELPVSALCMVECHQVIDPVLTTTDSKLVQSASHFVSNRHQRLYRREMEAFVFSKQLDDIPDLVIVPQRDANRAYYKRALQGQACDVAEYYTMPKALRKKYWIASADPQSAVHTLNEDLLALLQDRDWCTVQVIGGHCVVMTAEWHGNRPGAAPLRVEQIAGNTDFALRVFSCLQRSALTEHQQHEFADPAADAEGNGGGVATLAAPPQQRVLEPDPRQVAAATAPASQLERKKNRSRQPHSALKKLFLWGLGIPLLVVGGLATLGATAELQEGDQSLTWPQVKGLVTRSQIDTVAEEGRGKPVFVPDVEYKYAVAGTLYTNHEMTCGGPRQSADKQEIEQLLSKYPRGKFVTVFYRADDPQVAVLQPGVERRSVTVSARNVSMGMLGVGLLMCCYAVIGRKRTAAAPQ